MSNEVIAPAAQVFLDRLFGAYPLDAGYTVELRALPLQEDGEVLQKWFGLHKRALAIDWALSQAADRNIYVGVLPRLGRRGSKADVCAMAWLWCDLDAGGDAEGAQELLKRWIKAERPAPEMIVGSGGGLHLYWRLPEILELTPETRARAESVLRRLARALGEAATGAHADASGAEIARILRIPETLNHKYSPRREVTLGLVLDAPATPLCRWEEILPLDARIKDSAAFSGLSGENKRIGWTRTKSRDGRFGVSIPAPALEWAGRPTAPGGRNADMCSWARWMAQDCGLPKAIVLDILRQKRDVNPGPRMSDSEIEKIAKWA